MCSSDLLLVAAGTSPNVTYEKERPGSIPLDAKRKFFLPHLAVKGEGRSFTLVPKEDGAGAFFTGAQHDGKLVSYFGDNHPVYAGSVVKAMASGKHGAPKIRELFAAELDALDAAPSAQAERDGRWRAFAAELDDLLVARVERVERLTPTIVEIVVKAKAAARCAPSACAPSAPARRPTTRASASCGAAPRSSTGARWRSRPRIA